MTKSRPIVIGGTGGSGTRAVAQFCSVNGVHMGADLNESWDAVPFFPVLSRIIDPILTETRSLDYSPDDLPAEMRRDAISALEGAAEAHLKGWSGKSPWGFKNPRQIFVLPLLAALFPGLIFVHVVRDGRDVVLSDNQNQPRQHYAALFGEPWPGTPSSIERFWAATNLAAARCGSRLFGKNHVVVRIEDLCGTSGPEHAAKLANVLGVGSSVTARSAAIFRARPSFGRGTRPRLGPQTKHPDFEAALRQFGYI
jgi:hypothetical protein